VACIFGRGVRCYTLGDEWRGGSNITIEILQRLLTEVDKIEGGLPLNLIIQVDGSGKENKNSYVIVESGVVIVSLLFAWF
jgi:hypothetical protein